MKLQVKRFNKSETYISYNLPKLSEINNSYRKVVNLNNKYCLYCQLRENKRLSVGSVILNGHFSDLDKLGLVVEARKKINGVVVYDGNGESYSITSFRSTPNIIRLSKGMKRFFDSDNEKFAVKVVTTDYSVTINHIVPVFDSPHGVEIRLNDSLFGILADTMPGKGLEATVIKYQIDGQIDGELQHT